VTKVNLLSFWGGLLVGNYSSDILDVNSKTRLTLASHLFAGVFIHLLGWDNCTSIPLQNVGTMPLLQTKHIRTGLVALGRFHKLIFAEQAQSIKQF